MTVSKILNFVLETHALMCEYLLPFYLLFGAVFLIFSIALFVRSVFYSV